LTHVSKLKNAALPLVVGICVLVGLAVDHNAQAQDGKPMLILDADTANEIDDLYAIVRTLRQDRFEVLGLNSAQWFHYFDCLSWYWPPASSSGRSRCLGS